MSAPASPVRAEPGSDPRRRGRLLLGERVVEKIAGQAAAEVAGTSGRTGGVLGIGAQADATARPRVSVALTRDYADVEITLGVAYPASIRHTTERVRDRVTARVQALTGVPVHRVDIDVTFLTVDAADRPGVLR